MLNNVFPASIPEADNENIAQDGTNHRIRTAAPGIHLFPTGGEVTLRSSLAVPPFPAP